MTKFPYILALFFVSFLFLSCTDVERDSPCDEEAINYNKDVCLEMRGSYGSLYYEGQTYKTVIIGTQTWMAENLNYNPGTGNSICYDNQVSNCTTYGRLYDWSTAKTVCPLGWHLPSNAEWTTLVNFVGGSRVGTKLKATSGWYNNGNGTDNYGFSALPGGYGRSDGSFYGVGYDGYWWSATEGIANDAYYRDMGYDRDDVFNYNYDKSILFSVRCLQD